VTERTRLELLLRRDRWLVSAALIGVVLLSWAWIVPMARDMYGTMDGPSAWMMTMAWDAQYVALLFAMWSVMMIGMMLPSAAPAVLLYGLVVRQGGDTPHARMQIHVFALGYLASWVAFSALATGLQAILAHWWVITPMMETRSPVVGGGILIAAGLYQLTPLKRACLRHCRSPAEFLSLHWQTGVGGSFRMGFRFGLYCLGCCWALMLLLFAGGVMNLWWIVGLTVFVLLEKLIRWGDRGGRWSGLILAGVGVWMVVQASA